VTIPHDITPDQLKWLAGDYGHDDTCYTAGAHDPAGTCVITYRHHERCAINDGINSAADVSATVGGGTCGAETCDCTAVAIHAQLCPVLIKTFAGTCAHTTIISGLGNFTIKVEGAVVQADSFDGIFGSNPSESYASDALITLFS